MEPFGAGFPLFTDECNSLVKKHLTVEMYEALKDEVRGARLGPWPPVRQRACSATEACSPLLLHPASPKRTPNNFTLDRAIQSGVDNQDSGESLALARALLEKGRRRSRCRLSAHVALQGSAFTPATKSPTASLRPSSTPSLKTTTAATSPRTCAC